MVLSRHRRTVPRQVTRLVTGLGFPAMDRTAQIAKAADGRTLMFAEWGALDGEAGCEQVMHLIAGVRGAMAGLMAEVVEDHVRTHLVDAEQHPGALNTEAAEQLLDVVRTYLK